MTEFRRKPASTADRRAWAGAQRRSLEPLSILVSTFERPSEVLLSVQSLQNGTAHQRTTAGTGLLHSDQRFSDGLEMSNLLIQVSNIRFCLPAYIAPTRPGLHASRHHLLN